jgi:uncharacterized integral membrane protein (TIGR00698 family)
MKDTNVSAHTKSIAKSHFLMTEDWAVVVLGFMIIGLFLADVVVAPPNYSWSNEADLSRRIFSLSNLIRIIAEFSEKVLYPENLFRMFIQFLVVFTFSMLGTWITKKPLKITLLVFPILYAISVLAMIIAGNSAIRKLNLEAVIFSLVIGLIISNFWTLPKWFREVLSAEMFVKIGLVLLGTNVIFRDILKAGSLGLVQALVVVLTVWYFAFWICKRLKLDEELSMMISSAVSICGVSAAIATAGAIKGDAKKLSYVISLVLVTAIPMMILMPYAAKYMGLSQEVTGAWLGGTIDTTGAVVAAGTLVGETALKISTIVKFSQNVLLGLAAFAISLYWSYTQKTSGSEQVKPSLGLLWERFPKFVLGFVAASLLFSFFLSPQIIAPAKDGLKSIQTLWFVLAFTSIGLETKFSDLFNATNKKPLYAFLIAQAFNILVTLIIAYILFN